MSTCVLYVQNICTDIHALKETTAALSAKECPEVLSEDCKDVLVKVAKNYCNKEDLDPVYARL